YQQFLEGCRLSGVLAVLGHTPCKELVTALIERWRPETNTFHLVPGEATITLEDVEVLTGLSTAQTRIGDKLTACVCYPVFRTQYWLEGHDIH
ncbi:Serine/threonine-protein phosphatase 7 long form homolog, partial [Linum perenne]